MIHQLRDGAYLHIGVISFSLDLRVRLFLKDISAYLSLASRRSSGVRFVSA